MQFSKTFIPKFSSDIVRHIKQNPFAWLFSSGTNYMDATPLPLLADLDNDNEIISLTGHMARSNPHFKNLRSEPRALVVFLGPNSYISPSWCNNRKQVPSWNYVISQFVMDVEFYESPEFTHEALNRLVELMEHDQPEPWSIQELEERYHGLFRAVIGFRAHIVESNSKFKLGQNEKPDILRDVLKALKKNGKNQLTSWMENYNLDNTE